MVRRIYISVIAMLMVLLPLLPCAASNEVELYDDYVTITVPDDWDCYYNGWSDDGYYSMLVVEDEEYNVSVDGYLVNAGMDTDWDMDKESEAFDMYEEAGESVIQAFLVDCEEYSYGKVGLTEEKYIKPLEDDQFGYIRVKVDGSTHIYVTCREGGYFYIFMTCNYYEDKSDFTLKEMNDIIRSFNDTGYYLSADEYASEDEYYDADSDGDMDIAGVIFAVWIIMLIVIPRISDREEKRTVKMKLHKAVPKTGKGLKSKINESKSKVAKREETTTTVHTSYEESLRTLYKSGLLTKSELNEMLKKHRRG